jgi:hypothetical protein
MARLALGLDGGGSMDAELTSCLRRLGLATLVAAALPLWGCAEVALGVPVVTAQPIKTERISVPEANGIVGSVDQDGVQVKVTATRACDVVDQTTALETTTRERHNGGASKDWSLAGAGVLSLGSGAWALVDASKVYPSDKTSQNYNPIGPTAATGIGVALIVAGVALLAIPGVDVIRTSGTEVTTAQVTKNSEPLQRGVSCKGMPAAEAPVAVVFSDADRVAIGKTDDKGELRVDLDRALAERRPLPRFLDVLVGDTEIGNVNTSPISRQREEQEWQQLPLAACSSPTTSSSCAPISAFLQIYPDGAHATEARATLDKAKPALEKLAEAEAYKALDSDAVRGCRGLAGASRVRAVDPDAVDASCNTLQEFLTRYPNGAHAAEVTAVIRSGRALATNVRQQMLAQQRAAEAAERQQEAAKRAQDKSDCIRLIQAGCERAAWLHNIPMDICVRRAMEAQNGCESSN